MEIKTIWVLEGKAGFLDNIYALNTDGKMYKWDYQSGDWRPFWKQATIIHIDSTTPDTDKIYSQIGGPCQVYAHELCTFKKCTCACHQPKEITEEELDKSIDLVKVGDNISPNYSPQLPQKLQAHIGWSTADYDLKNKINELITYLESLK